LVKGDLLWYIQQTLQQNIQQSNYTILGEVDLLQGVKKRSWRGLWLKFLVGTCSGRIIWSLRRRPALVVLAKLLVRETLIQGDSGAAATSTVFKCTRKLGVLA
jgi:hypothetical protein